MAAYIIICLTAVIGSGLTLFSGFGLGTILVPVFAVFFPIDIAIVLTAIVHFLNNLFKLILLGKNIDKKTVLLFGVPAIFSALFGAYLLTRLTHIPPLFEYTIAAKPFYITPIKVIIAILLVVFALFDTVPQFAKLQFHRKYLPLGGVLSGFFGGLSGHQGALRSAFLLRANLTKEAFIATGVAIACLIDVSRLIIYSNQVMNNRSEINYGLVAVATLAAFLGAYLGNLLLKKVTIKTLQYIVAAMLIIFAFLLAAGIV